MNFLTISNFEHKNSLLILLVKWNSRELSLRYFRYFYQKTIQQNLKQVFHKQDKTTFLGYGLILIRCLNYLEGGNQTLYFNKENLMQFLIFLMHLTGKLLKQAVSYSNLNCFFSRLAWLQCLFSILHDTRFLVYVQKSTFLLKLFFSGRFLNLNTPVHRSAFHVVEYEKRFL